MAFLFLLISCQTAPRLPDAVLDETAFIPLEPGALAYVFADVKGARPILDLIPLREIDPGQSKEMLDRTRTLVAALYPPESGRRLQLTAWGSYPALRAGMALGSNRDWQKQRSSGGESYWYSAVGGLSLALNARQAYVAASADSTPNDPFAAAGGVEAPAGFGAFRRGALLSCWLEKPSARINRSFERLQIPLQIPAERIFISIFPAASGELYEALVRIETPGSTQARALVTLFSMASVFAAGTPPSTGTSPGQDNRMELLSLLFTNPPVQDGASLNLKIAPLTGAEITLLFSLFSVY